MADKNIQFKETNGDLLFPKTIGEMVDIGVGTLSEKLQEQDTAIETNKTAIENLGAGQTIGYDIIE